MAHVTVVRLKAFKSIGPAWVDVPFEPGLNAIVGPNGCGKSSLLDALCFAFAAPLRTFAVASLADLANSDTSEVCEVAVTLQDGSGQAHTVHAALTPDGGRAFKVDGRNRSGREVREFLRGLGMRLDSAAAVIKQAQVTRLADSNSPADLAAVVAEASGLGRWNDEVAAATEELHRTRKALADVHASLATIERGVAADAEKLQALERYEAAELDAAALAQQMAGLLQASSAMCAAAAMAGTSSGDTAAERVAAAREAEVQQRGELEAAQAALAAAQSDQDGSGDGGGGDLLLLQQQVAAAEEEVRLLDEHLQRRQQLEAALEAERAAVARLVAARAAEAAELATTQQAQRRLGADLAAAQSAASAGDVQASLAAEIGQLAAAVAVAVKGQAVEATAVDQTSSRLSELQVEQQRLATALKGAQQAAGNTSSPGCASQQAALQVQVHQQQAQLAQLHREEQRLQADAGTLAVRLAGSCGSSGGGGGNSTASTAWRPLHLCFSFSDPTNCQQYSQALQVLAGGRLGVLVADSTAAAAQLLDSSAARGARIWPLGGLAVTDYGHQQRSAAQRFAAGTPAASVCF